MIHFQLAFLQLWVNIRLTNTSLIRFTLTLYNQSLEGYIEGGYDVISVDREADKYIVEYTYGDYYSHDAVKKCEITVGNDGLIISDIME